MQNGIKIITKKETKEYLAPNSVTDKTLNKQETTLTVSLMAQQMNKFLR